MGIEELCAIIRMQLFDGKGLTLQDMTEACFHRLLLLAKDGYPLTPASGYIDHLQRKSAQR